MAEMLAFIALAIAIVGGAEIMDDIRSGRRDSRNRNRR
jgi:hypothetical protein